MVSILPRRLVPGGGRQSNRGNPSRRDLQLPSVAWWFQWARDWPLAHDPFRPAPRPRVLHRPANEVVCEPRLERFNRLGQDGDRVDRADDDTLAVAEEAVTLCAGGLVDHGPRVTWRDRLGGALPYTGAAGDGSGHDRDRHHCAGRQRLVAGIRSGRPYSRSVLTSSASTLRLRAAGPDRSSRPVVADRRRQPERRSPRRERGRQRDRGTDPTGARRTSRPSASPWTLAPAPGQCAIDSTVTSTASRNMAPRPGLLSSYQRAASASSAAASGPNRTGRLTPSADQPHVPERLPSHRSDRQLGRASLASQARRPRPSLSLQDHLRPGGPDWRSAGPQGRRARHH